LHPCSSRGISVIAAARAGSRAGQQRNYSPPPATTEPEPEQEAEYEEEGEAEGPFRKMSFKEVAAFKRDGFMTIARLGRDWEVKETRAGPLWTSIIPVDPPADRKQEGVKSKWLEICIWDETLGAAAQEEFRKGTEVALAGRLKFDEWTGQDGEVRRKMRVNVESLAHVDRSPPQEEEGEE